jgi:hypothetical protein
VGARANYIIVDDDGWRLYYSHWGAQGIARQLAAGPRHALWFITRQQPRDPETGWLDETWAEGAALVDIPRRQLIFFGASEDIFWQFTARRAYLAVLRETWPGWTVEWAFDELADLAVHVGVDASVVRTPDADRQPLMALAPQDDLNDGFWALLSVREPDGLLRAWAMQDQDHLAWAGQALVDLLPEPAAAKDHVAGDPPLSGLHVDLATRRMGFWTSRTIPSLLREAPRLWPGWQLEFWHDDYERHLRECGDTLTAPRVDLTEAFDQLAHLGAPQRDPTAFALDILQTLRAEGQKVKVTGPITAHVEVDMDHGDQEWFALGLARARRRALGAQANSPASTEVRREPILPEPPTCMRSAGREHC